MSKNAGRKLVYVSTSWDKNFPAVMERASNYCQLLYQAGYAPVCPMLMFSCFLKLEDPKARTEMLGMCKSLMSKCWCLFVCGDPGCEDIALDIATAKALHVEVMSLSGIIDFGGKS